MRAGCALSDKSGSNKSRLQNATIYIGNEVENGNVGKNVYSSINSGSTTESVCTNHDFDEPKHDDAKIPPPKMASSRPYVKEQLKDKQYNTIKPDTLPALRVCSGYPI
ncbi:hypothetical protein RIF29_14994 [Crotalaria pallida]|uniref:Uncharacterized protein n=1 Tax=Crotalaria pallida TaxID=3830 RepID=A0AAN9FCC4_CROPI